MIGATAMSPPDWIKFPPQGLEPVYHLRKVPLPPFTCKVTGVPLQVGLVPETTEILVGLLFVTVTDTVADAQAPVLQVFSQRA
jgi:hypothetical protein